LALAVVVMKAASVHAAHPPPLPGKPLASRTANTIVAAMAESDETTRTHRPLAAPPVVMRMSNAALQHPLTSLAVLAPLCLIGEVLRVIVGSSPASGQLLADPLLSHLGRLVGLHLPFVSFAVLLAWWLIVQVGGRYPWQLPPVKTFAQVLGWAVVWMTCRIAIAFASAQVVPDSIAGTAGLLISGAMQEELLFRGIVLGLGLCLIRLYDWPSSLAIWFMLPLSATFFSLAHTTVVNHHAGAEIFAWPTFIERALAGCIYGYAFLRHGLAVAVLAHLGYLLILETGIRF